MKTIITTKSSLSKTISHIIEKRELFFLLTKREIHLRYKYKVIGILWGVLQPLLLAFVISQSLGKITGNTLDIKYYFLTVFVGYTFWMYFSSTVGKAMSSLVSGRMLIQNAAFPHIILPLTTLAVGCIDLFASFVIILVLGSIIGFHFYFLPFFFISFLLLLTTTIGIAVLFTALYARFTDLRELIGFSMTILFYVTPVIYPVKIVPLQYHMYLYINPMTGVIETAKASLLNPQTIPFLGLGISFFSSILLLLLGFFVFEKIDKSIVDTL